MDQARNDMRTTEAADMRTGVKPVASNVLPWSAVAVVLFGAIWFGLMSCGGYAWHKTMFYGVAFAVVGAALLLPSNSLNSLRRKAVFFCALVCGYYVVEAAAAPFYLSLPGSATEYFGLFRISLERGPCG
ncbi:hypothetical protein [Roseateles sp. BYS96W]|uniref:Uncharacterized protein n=1 Tax=Pelomonas nitida TaxID=3299027 RepID=A0ABW7GBI7_9BURK